MNILQTKGFQYARVVEIHGYNHECRMHGVKPGVKVVMVYQYRNMVVMIINDRETVTIPKEIAKYVIVEAV